MVGHHICNQEVTRSIRSHITMHNDSVPVEGRDHRPSPRPRGSARRKTASSLILRGHF